MTTCKIENLALDVRALTVSLRSDYPVVDDVSLHVHTGEALGLVGESGSGKTTVALALLGYARKGMRISKGTVTIAGRTIELQHESLARRARGSIVSHVPQDPATSLNPSLRIGASLRDIMRRSAKNSGSTVASAFQRVHLPTSEEFLNRFPHQLSGGQQQRVLIAAALANEPPLIVLDEPTTGLDVVTQARVLKEVRCLHVERGVAMVYVSHDLAVVSEIADRIIVMYAGRVVEEGPAATVLTRPRHPYTRGLVSSIPDHAAPQRLEGIPGVAVSLGDRPAGCAFAPRCSQVVERCRVELPELEDYGNGQRVRCFEAHQTPELRRMARPGNAVSESGNQPLLVVDSLSAEHKRRGGKTVVANKVSFSIPRSSCVALVGESGSGKTTIARAIAGLHPPSGGVITLDGEPLAGEARRRTREQRQRCQIIFQNPYESLNPRQQVGSEVSRPARVLRGLSASDASQEARRLLDRVRLPVRLASKFPSELSGGERQRVAIARALAAGPDLLICDEITSALDVSVQAAILELLQELREELGLALLFITHNLGVVASIADRVLILDRGTICEEGLVGAVFTAPVHPRTRELLAAAPRLMTSGLPA